MAARARRAAGPRVAHSTCSAHSGAVPASSTASARRGGRSPSSIFLAAIAGPSFSAASINR